MKIYMVAENMLKSFSMKFHVAVQPVLKFMTENLYKFFGLPVIND